MREFDKEIERRKAAHWGRRAMTHFLIEKGVPFPDKPKGGRPKVYRWEDMDIGDSVLVGSYETAKQAVSWGSRRALSFIYEKQTDGSGWRVWRMK